MGQEPTKPADMGDDEWNALGPNEKAALSDGDEDDAEALKGADDELQTAEEKEAAAKEEAAKAAKEAEAEAAKERTELEAKAKAAREAADKAKEEAGEDAAKKAEAEKAEAAAKAAEEARDESKKETAEAAAAAKKAEEEAAAAKAKAAAAGAEEDEPFQPRYVAPPVPDFDKKITALDERTKAATAKFKAGTDDAYDIDAYNAERDAIEKERRELEAANLKATISQEGLVQTAEQKWDWEVGRFFRKVHREEGIDYADSNRLNKAMDDEVKRLSKIDEHKDKSSRWFLEEAHKGVKAKLGLKPSTDTAAAKAAAAEAAEKTRKESEAKAKALAARKVDKTKLPASLGGAPQAGEDDTGGESEFAHLDDLEGMDLENALAKMKPEEAARYLAGN